MMSQATDRASRSLWGVGPAGPIHFGYDAAAVEQIRLTEKGCSHTVLFADLHVMMSHGLSYAEARQRSHYYEAVFSAGYGIEARFVNGSEFELTPEYQTLLLGLASCMSISPLAAALPQSVTRTRGSERTLGTLLYPLMQCLDAVYLGVDVVLADKSQRKTYDLLNREEALAGIQGLVDHRADGERHAIPVDFRYFDLATDIRGKPLNESTSRTRISIHETSDSLRTKVRSMFAPPAVAKSNDRQNALLYYIHHSAVPWVGRPILVETRDGLWSGDSAEALDLAYSTGELHPNDLKNFLFDVLLDRVHRFRERLATVSYDWIDMSVSGRA